MPDTPFPGTSTYQWNIGGLSYPGSYQAVYGVIQYGTGENWSDQQTVGFSYVP